MSNEVEGETLQQSLVGLPEVESTSSVFSSSGASILLPSDQKRHPIAVGICVLLAITSILGLVNGIDYIDGDSGLINHRRFINMDAMAAEPGTAILQGVVVFDDGSPASGYPVQVTLKDESGMTWEKMNVTDQNGNFRIEGLDPGVQVLLIANGSRQGDAQLVQHLVLLNPPPKVSFEPYGFTTLRLTFPSDSVFENESEDGSFLNYVPYEAANEKQLYDSSAAGMYVMVGVGFSGLAVIGMGATFLAYKDGSRGMLRTAAVLVFFSQGPIGSACCLGFVAFALTFAVPKNVV